MNNIFTYIVELNIAVSVFFLIYTLIFKKDSNFNNRRAFLLFAMGFSFIAPFIKIELFRPVPLLNSTIITLEEFILVAGKGSSEVSHFSFMEIITIIYLLISFFFLGKLILSVTSVLMNILQSEKARLHGVKVRLNSKLHASSFFGIIFIDPTKSNDEDLKLILEHESYHVRLFHSLDRILSELLISISWFNPIIWLLRKAIVVNHEYQADNRVVEHGTDQISYQLTILNQYIGSASISNQFSNHIKNRINMLNKNYKKGSFWKSFLIFPISIILLFFMACGNDVGVDENTVKNPAGEEKTVKNSAGEELYYIVEDMPTFNGGDPKTEFRKYIGNHLEYPALAIENGISGTVVIQFTVNTKGKVVDADVVKSVDPVLDKEALRVILSSPAWTPGKQKGKKVAVLFTFPINFKLK